MGGEVETRHARTACLSVCVRDVVKAAKNVKGKGKMRHAESVTEKCCKGLSLSLALSNKLSVTRSLIYAFIYIYIYIIGKEERKSNTNEGNSATHTHTLYT